MNVKENKNFSITFDNEEMTSARTVDEALECVLSLMEDETLTNMETKEALDAEDIETAQNVLRMLFSKTSSNWEY